MNSIPIRYQASFLKDFRIKPFHGFTSLCFALLLRLLLLFYFIPFFRCPASVRHYPVHLPPFGCLALSLFRAVLYVSSTVSVVHLFHCLGFFCLRFRRVLFSPRSRVCVQVRVSVRQALASLLCLHYTVDTMCPLRPLFFNSSIHCTLTVTIASRLLLPAPSLELDSREAEVDALSVALPYCK